MAASTAESVLVVFQIAGEHCAIPAASVAGILPMARLARSPGLPSVLEGLLNLRGEAVPVIRLDRLFGLPRRDPGLHSHLVLLRGPAGLTALLADRATGVAAPPPEAFRPLDPARSFNGCAVGLADWSGNPVHVLDPERLLVEQERQAVDEFRSLSQRYLDELPGRGAP